MMNVHFHRHVKYGHHAVDASKAFALKMQNQSSEPKVLMHNIAVAIRMILILTNAVINAYVVIHAAMMMLRSIHQIAIRNVFEI